MSEKQIKKYKRIMKRAYQRYYNEGYRDAGKTLKTMKFFSRIAFVFGRKIRPSQFKGQKKEF